jgi:ubiquinone/menaquinone biosynthesis C-methylase UbiE
MAALKFDDEMGRIQRALAECHDMVLRRSTVLETVNARTGEAVLEIGCGGGFYAREVAKMVGPSGRVCACDISDDQIASARERCAEFSWVECETANALELPYGAGEFDAVYCVQILEYVSDVNDALSEIHRVLRPGGRVVNLATNWDSLVWHSEEPERMKRVLAAWDEHALHPNLPAGLLARMADVGLNPLGQVAQPVLNTSYNENSFSYWLAKMISAFVAGHRAFKAGDAKSWLSEFDDLEGKGAYFFSSTPVITEAIKIS